MAKKKVLMNWELHNCFGYGLLGMNTFFHWANDPDIMPLMGEVITSDAMQFVDPLRLDRVSRAVTDSNDYLERIGGGLAARSGTPIKVDATVIDVLADLLEPSHVSGNVDIGRAVFVDTKVAGVAGNLAKYQALVCGSNWNAEILRAQTQRDVKVIFEGIDPSLFFPGPRSGLYDSANFYIYSGGKIEFRKAQDLVLLAFREFSKRHPNAYLVTAWHSPWPSASVGFRGKLEAPLELDKDGLLNIKKWVADNGIDSNRVIEIFRMPNHLLPMVLREMDVALQPSRAEPCTNLPVKEAMACGIPVIVAENTGMLDLITEDNCVRIGHQQPIPDSEGYDCGKQGWGESSVDELVDALEQLYSDEHRRRQIGIRGAKWITATRTWQIHARRLKEFVLSVS